MSQLASKLSTLYARLGQAAAGWPGPQPEPAHARAPARLPARPGDGWMARAEVPRVHVHGAWPLSAPHGGVQP